jgi:hypothetical protein
MKEARLETMFEDMEAMSCDGMFENTEAGTHDMVQVISRKPEDVLVNCWFSTVYAIG